MSESDFVYLTADKVPWQKGVIFSCAPNHTTAGYWLVEEVNGNQLTYSYQNKPQYGKGHSSIQELGPFPYYFVKDTLKPIDPQVAVINKIKYLDKRFLDRQQKKVLT